MVAVKNNEPPWETLARLAGGVKYPASRANTMDYFCPDSALEPGDCMLCTNKTWIKGPWRNATYAAKWYCYTHDITFEGYEHTEEEWEQPDGEA